MLPPLHEASLLHATVCGRDFSIEVVDDMEQYGLNCTAEHWIRLKRQNEDVMLETLHHELLEVVLQWHGLMYQSYDGSEGDWFYIMRHKEFDIALTAFSNALRSIHV